MAGWITKTGLLAAGFAAIAESAQKLSVVLSDSMTAKVFAGLIVLGGALVLLRHFFRKLERRHHSDHASTVEKKEAKSEGALMGLGLVVFAAIAFLTSAVVLNPSTSVPSNAQRSEDRWTETRLSQLNCPSGDCGFGGPSVDPEDNPDQLRPEDYNSYLRSKPKLRSSNICSISIRQTGRDLYDIRLRVPAGSTCQKYFPSSTSGSTWLSEYRPPENGGHLRVTNHGFAYVAAEEFRGTDRFIVEQWSYPIGTNDLRTILRYTVEVI